MAEGNASRPRVAFAMREGLRDTVFSATALERLAAVAEVEPGPVLAELESDEARKVLARSEILLTSWGAPLLDARQLERAPYLRAVIHAAGSVKHHLTPDVWARGVVVTSAADVNAVPVAEYTLATILLAGKGILAAAAAYRADPEGTDVTAWPTIGNYAKRVGVIGASRIGRLVCDLLRPFGFEVVIADPYLDDAGASALGARLVTLEELFATSDIVTLHAPDLPETRHLVDATRLASLKDGATFINTARGALVDHGALTRELRSGRVNAVLDVTTPEPLPADSPLLALPNALVTPHVAGSLGTELFRLGDAAVEEVERLAAGEPPLRPVTLDDLARQA